MRFALIQVLTLSIPCSACGVRGVFFVGFVSNPGGTSSITGTISILHFGFVSPSSGNSTSITAVTFINAGNAATVNFCGDERDQFPMDKLVRADFNKGVSCSSLVTVVVIT
jgi:hypothetical protein